MRTTDTGRKIHDGPRLVVQAHAEGPSTTVTVRGQVDASTAPLLRAVLDAVHARRPGRVTIDLSETALLDTQGLRTLIAARRRLSARRAVLVLHNPTTAVRRVIDAARLGTAFTITDDHRVAAGTRPHRT